jgi:ADP-ribose pyrophosphatase
MKHEIRRIKEELVYSDPENPWLKLYFDQVQFPDGGLGRYNRIVEGMGDPGVAVLPISSRGLGLVFQYRYAIGHTVWEIPRGYGDSDNPVREARRELREETGLDAKEVIALGTIHPNSAVFATRVELFAAKCDPTSVKSTTDGREYVEFRWFSVEEIMQLIEANELSDAFTLSALFRAKMRGLI